MQIYMQLSLILDSGVSKIYAKYLTHACFISFITARQVCGPAPGVAAAPGTRAGFPFGSGCLLRVPNPFATFSKNKSHP